MDLLEHCFRHTGSDVQPDVLAGSGIMYNYSAQLCQDVVGSLEGVIKCRRTERMSMCKNSNSLKRQLIDLMLVLCVHAYTPKRQSNCESPSMEKMM
jgi:hypothetical protein